MKKEANVEKNKNKKKINEVATHEIIITYHNHRSEIAAPERE